MKVIRLCDEWLAHAADADLHRIMVTSVQDRSVRTTTLVEVLGGAASKLRTNKLNGYFEANGLDDDNSEIVMFDHDGRFKRVQWATEHQEYPSFYLAWGPGVWSFGDSVEEAMKAATADGGSGDYWCRRFDGCTRDDVTVSPMGDYELTRGAVSCVFNKKRVL